MVRRYLYVLYYLVCGHWGYFYNGNDKRDGIIEFLRFTLYPWHAIEMSHCMVCNSEFTDRGIRAWPPVKRWFMKCPYCGGKARPMNNDELMKRFILY